MGKNKTLDIKQRKQLGTVMHLISYQKIELICELAIAFSMPSSSLLVNANSKQFKMYI